MPENENEFWDSSEFRKKMREYETASKSVKSATKEEKSLKQRAREAGLKKSLALKKQKKIVKDAEDYFYIATLRKLGFGYPKHAAVIGTLLILKKKIKEGKANEELDAANVAFANWLEEPKNKEFYDNLQILINSDVVSEETAKEEEQ